MRADMMPAANIVGSNLLADLRKRLKIEHAAVANSLRTSLSHAMASGDIVMEAKARLKHGEWLPWLKSGGVPERTAQRWARPARHRAVIESKPDTTRRVEQLVAKTGVQAADAGGTP
jgi:hypothetical protein